MSIKLRTEYQLPAHNATIDHCRKSTDPVIHNQSVGAGKSYQICFFAKHVIDKGGRALMLTRQGELVEQNANDYWDIGGKCSIYSASLGKKSTYYPCIMGTEGTIYRSLNSAFKNSAFNVLLIDECHMVDWQDVIECQKSHLEGFDIYTNKDKEGKTRFSQYAVILCHFLMLNPKTRIIGYTGSPYRGTETIVCSERHGFWKKELSTVTTHELVELGYLVPYKFGFGDDEHHYNYSDKFKKVDERSDFSSSELAAMGREACKQKDITQLIIEEVMDRTKDRLGVLITCAGKKHCEQCAEFLPKNTWGIVTDSTSTKERKRILDGAKDGSIKYVLQIGCLTTGVNVPLWDCCVILRNIGSLTLLIQLIGRVLRTLKPHQIDSGIQKHDALVLDYSDTLECLGEFFDNPIINDASAALASKKNKTQECPVCQTENSEFAVRCRGVNSDLAEENERIKEFIDSAHGPNISYPKPIKDIRCEHFFRSSICLNCATENAPTARNCRKCDAVMIDPSLSLNNKAYTDADYKPVLSMDLSETKSGKLCVTYRLNSFIQKDGAKYPEIAREFINPYANPQPYEKQQWHKFVSDHIKGERFQRMFKNARNIDGLIKNKAMLDVPMEITHRINSKGFSIINRKRFNNGREEMAG